MGKKILVNKYVPNYVPKNSMWYERDGLMTYVDRLKYEEFESNINEHFQKAEVINLDIINNRCRAFTKLLKRVI